MSQFSGGFSRESFLFTTSIISGFWGKSCTNASFSHLQYSRFFREVSCESFLSTSSIFSLFEGSLARDAFLRDTGCATATGCVLQHKTRRGRWMGKVCRAAVGRRSRVYWDHPWIILRSAPQCSCHFRRRFANLKLSAWEGSLARKLRFHVFNYLYSLIFGEKSRKNFIFTSLHITFWRKSCTKAVLSHLHFLGFEGGLARKLRFHRLKLQGCGKQSTLISRFGAL